MATLRQSDGWVMAFLILFVFALRIFQLDSYPIPTPVVQDEWANIFAAETFASGHLTNPIHPLQEFFKAPHILDTPTVMSKYPPGASAFMALGKILAGHAYWGVVLAAALSIAATYWAILGWISPRRIAFGAAFMLALLFKAPNYWMDSYWGGAPALLAAMLILGAYPRIFYANNFVALWPGVIGAMLGFATRPYETGVLTLWLLIASFRHMPKGFFAALRMPLLAFVAFIGWNLYYNQVVTHHPLHFPHTEYTKLYGIAPLFLTENAYEHKLSDNPVVASGQRFEIESRKEAHPIGYRMFAEIPVNLCYVWCVDGAASSIAHDILTLQQLACLLLLPLLLLAFIFGKHYRGRLELAGAAILLLIASSIATGTQPHYLAPLLSVIIIMLSQIAARRRILIAILIIALMPSFFLRHMPYGMDKKFLTHREAIEKELLAMPDESLVFVDHSVEAKTRPVGEVWIYNPPDLAHTKIIWALYRSPAENRKLIDLYPGRKLWYVEPYREHKLLPYPPRGTP